ncbi:imidazole glycerol phosphate synthase subunit hisF [Enterococcus silesiacus]|uniref:Imidazole glycerol phosphate synthase subunit HisF n=1 Tax=Enterococcus silesiacus TaxID=332949 RepID=A0AA91GDD7_9ENTE|nr:imidazole glycerol phosphate synthase subunit hisF [Enterococcus silesiacus]
MVKGVNFIDLQDVGDPVAIARAYNEQGADELVFLDITATSDNRETMIDVVERTATAVFIPLTVGGGIRSVFDMKKLLQAGADKIALNSAAIQQPELITAGAEKFGSQCIVVAIDAKRMGDSWHVFVKGGREDTGLDVISWAKKAVALGAGELLLTSMDADGTKKGYDLALNQAVSTAVNVPVIASGGCGNANDIVEVFEQTKVSAALAASIFHYGEVSIPDLKTAMALKGMEVRK